VIRINLAPPSVRPPQVRRSLVAVAGGAACIVVLAGFGWWYALLRHDEMQLNKRINILRHELTSHKALLGRGERMREAFADLTKRARALQELTRGQDTTIRILDAFLDVIPAELWLTSLEGRGLELRAVGSARSARAVANLMLNLRASGKFSEVEIVTSKQDVGKIPPAPVTFEVTCRFRT
jgi:Tfp pilus assembly protein PilN